MATSLPPPGAARPRPPLAPPSSPEPPSQNGQSAPDALLGALPPTTSEAPTAGLDAAAPPAPPVLPPPPPEQPAGEPERFERFERQPMTVAPLAPPGLATDEASLPPPKAETAWPSVDDQRRKRQIRRQCWILTIGFGLIVLAFALIAHTAWLLGAPQVWVTWTSVALAPAALTALAALLGWSHAMKLALFVTAWQIVIAIVALVLRPSIGLPQAVCALAAVAITAAAWRSLPPDDQATGEEPPEPAPVIGSIATEPPRANTAG